MTDKRLKVIGEFPEGSQIIFSSHEFERVIVKKKYYDKDTGQQVTDVVTLENGYMKIIVNREKITNAAPVQEGL